VQADWIIDAQFQPAPQMSVYNKETSEAPHYCGERLGGGSPARLFEEWKHLKLPMQHICCSVTERAVAVTAA